MGTVPVQESLNNENASKTGKIIVFSVFLYLPSFLQISSLYAHTLHRRECATFRELLWRTCSELQLPTEGTPGDRVPVQERASLVSSRQLCRVSQGLQESHMNRSM